MTDIEKARAYDEALERARKSLRAASDIGTDIVTFIFPQLRESDDERIRKELVEAFEAYDIESSWNGIPVRSVLAWLEKQKEQKPVDYEAELKKCKDNPLYFYDKYVSIK